MATARSVLHLLIVSTSDDVPATHTPDPSGSLVVAVITTDVLLASTADGVNVVVRLVGLLNVPVPFDDQVTLVAEPDRLATSVTGFTPQLVCAGPALTPASVWHPQSATTAVSVAGLL